MKVHVVTLEPEDFKRHNVTVAGAYSFYLRHHWRVRVGMALIRLAGWVAGFGVDEEQEDEG